MPMSEKTEPSSSTTKTYHELMESAVIDDQQQLFPASQGRPSHLVVARLFRRFPNLLAVVSILSLMSFALSIAAVTSTVISSKSDASPASAAGIVANSVHAIPLRFFPGKDVVASLMEVVNSRKLQSAWISTAVGSLTHYNIRFANMPDGSTGDGHFEIVSLVGTLTCLNITNVTRSYEGAWHLHISVGDSNGTMVGGHLLVGSLIYTTLELVLMYDCNKVFYRADDGSTGWDELQVANKTWC